MYASQFRLDWVCWALCFVNNQEQLRLRGGEETSTCDATFTLHRFDTMLCALAIISTVPCIFFKLTISSHRLPSRLTAISEETPTLIQPPRSPSVCKDLPISNHLSQFLFSHF